MVSVPAQGARDLRDITRTVGTYGRTNDLFRQIVANKYSAGLDYPGYLIGIEKANRKIIGVGSKRRVDRFIQIVKSRSPYNKFMRKRLRETKRSFISHIVKFNHYSAGHEYQLSRIRPQFLYNVYDEVQAGTLPRHKIYQRSWHELYSLKKQIRQDIQQNHYTHVLVFVMGWQTPQIRSMSQVNSLVGHTLDSAYRNKNARFKPLIITFTWPSQWAVPGISAFSKAHDADEIGIVWANALLNDVLLPLKQDAKSFKVVMIGHSFGARTITQAAFGRKYLSKRQRGKTKLDLLIGLQAAFEVKRFIPHSDGRHGSPYANYSDRVHKVALTWSENDTANRFAKYIADLNFIGGRFGYEVASDATCNRYFEFLKVGSNGLIKNSNHGSERILYLDATNVVSDRRYKRFGKAHSDIFKPEMGRLLWTLIKRYTY